MNRTLRENAGALRGEVVAVGDPVSSGVGLMRSM
jgi:hypothetical protein